MAAPTGSEEEQRVTALSVSCADSSPRGRAKGEPLGVSQKSSVGASIARPRKAAKQNRRTANGRPYDSSIVSPPS